MQDARSNPFDLANDTVYRRWRKQKLQGYPVSADSLMVTLANPVRLSTAERARMLGNIRKTNITLYRFSAAGIPDRECVRELGRQFGLETLDNNLRSGEDSITSLRVVDTMPGTHYIPYTNKPLNWHTDGYYNSLAEQVRGIVMHCARPSARGGENAFLDPEIAYLLMRDESPDYVAAMMHSRAMTVPANREGDVEIRGEQPGPVFSLEKHTGALHMRYTARTRSIAWRDDPDTQAAVRFLQELLASDSPYIFRYRLNAGEGIICNNVLHSRSAFEDGDADSTQRLLYRARYHERIAGTGIQVTEANDAVAE